MKIFNSTRRCNNSFDVKSTRESSISRRLYASTAPSLDGTEVWALFTRPSFFDINFGFPLKSKKGRQLREEMRKEVEFLEGKGVPAVVHSVIHGVGEMYHKNTQTFILWVGFMTMSFVVYCFLSSGDFSFLLTYAAFIRCFGCIVLNYRMWSSKSAKGVSLKTLELYAVTFVVRLISIMSYQGYLPFDKTGDWFYHFVELLSLISICLAIYGIVGPLISTYDEKYDKFGNLHIPSQYGVVYILAPCFIMALFIKPNLNRDFASDMFWAYSMYLEAAAMLPQIYMFHNKASDKERSVDMLLGHTVFALGIARVFELIFWVGSFRELADRSGSRLPGYIVLLSQVAHLIVMADFFYYYIIAVREGRSMELPVNSSYNYPVMSNV